MQKPIKHRFGIGFPSRSGGESQADRSQEDKGLGASFATLDTGDPDFATHAVARMLDAAQYSSASDVHLQPSAGGLEVLFRVDGVLHPVTTFPTGVAPNVVARLKILAELLTYRTDVPQEGRIISENVGDQDRSEGSVAQNRRAAEMRVSTFPTLYGERAVVRLFAGSGRYNRIDDLGFPEQIATQLRDLLQRPAGAIIATGPAGSGKTTTIYACLRELARRCGDVRPEQRLRRNIVSLEDPIEVALQGVSQSQVGSRAGFDLATGLQFLMRQDPEVIMVGEIRDPATAKAALQASLTGHLLLTTFHAGSAAEAIGRLLDMGIEPYLLRSGLLAIVSQRLARTLCECARESVDPGELLDFPMDRVSLPVGCEACRQSGFRARFVLAEMLLPDRSDLGDAIISRSDTGTIERLAVKGGMKTQWQRGLEAVADGKTSPREVHRVLGDSTACRGEAGRFFRNSEG